MKLLKWLGIVALVLVGVPLLMNLRDEKLTPEAIAFMKAERPAVADEQNAYYHVLGFDAALADDPHKAGKAWLAAVDAAQVKLLAGTPAPWPEAPKGLPKIDSVCAPEKASCIRSLKDNAEAHLALAKQAAVVARYRRLHSYPAYLESGQARLYAYPLPRYLPLADAQRLFLLDVAQRLERGEAHEAMAALRDDIAFARRMLAGSRTLIHKMAAAAQLQRAVLFASDALNSHRAAIGPRAAILAEALTPLTDPERAITPALRSELVMAASAMEPGRWRGEDVGLGVHGALLKPFYKHNATVNTIYRFTRAWSDVDYAPAPQLTQSFERAKAGEPQYSVAHLVYNPVGKLLFSNNAPSLSGYFERLHDADALVRMVALQADVVAQELKPEDVAAVAERSRNPYTGKPYDWDVEKRQLSFEPRSRVLKEQKIGGTADRVTLQL